MSPLDHHAYVCLEQYRLQHLAPSPAEQARLEWLAYQSQVRLARRHAAARWLGARLVRVGERLQGWADSTAPAGQGSFPPATGG